MGCLMEGGVVGGGGADGLDVSPDPDCSCTCFRLVRSSELVELLDDDVGLGASVMARPPDRTKELQGA